MRNNTQRKERTQTDRINNQGLPGLNLQAPWTSWILNGTKTVETRFYPLPQKYVDKEMFIIETPGKTGKFKARIVGVVVFGKSFKYASKKAFYDDRSRHLVDVSSSDFSWACGNGKAKWGWPIKSIVKKAVPLPSNLKRGILFTKKISL